MIVLLDSGPLGLLVHPNIENTSVAACRSWAEAHIEAGHIFALPGVIEYELKRELIRIQSRQSLVALVEITRDFDYLPVTRDVLNLAAEFWARARQANLPAAENTRIDIDMILAGHAAQVTSASPNQSVVIATTNTRHFAGLADAQDWRAIAP